MLINGNLIVILAIFCEYFDSDVTVASVLKLAFFLCLGIASLTVNPVQATQLMNFQNLAFQQSDTARKERPQSALDNNAQFRNILLLPFLMG